MPFSLKWLVLLPFSVENGSLVHLPFSSDFSRGFRMENSPPLPFSVENGICQNPASM